MANTLYTGSTSLTKRTTYTLNAGENIFSVPIKPEYPDEVKVIVADNTATLYYLVDDERTEDWYFDGREEGEFYGQSNRLKGYRPLNMDEREQLAAENPGRVFLIDYFEHGNCRYSRAGKYSADRWDTSPGIALYVVPEDASNPEQYCDAVMAELTAWANGDIHATCEVHYTRASDTDVWVEGEYDLCGGYLGKDNADAVLDELMGQREVNSDGV